MKNIYEEIKKVFESKVSEGILYAILMVVIALLFFLAGMLVGFNKASYSRAWGDHYYENFGVPTGPLDIDDLPNSHGAVGKITKVELPNIIVTDAKNNIEKVISISDDTKIQKGPSTVTPKDLSIDDFIVVVGQPDDKGVIDAKFIRVVPNPESLK